jgi:hypothetical protein
MIAIDEHSEWVLCWLIPSRSRERRERRALACGDDAMRELPRERMMDFSRFVRSFPSERRGVFSIFQRRNVPA